MHLEQALGLGGEPDAGLPLRAAVRVEEMARQEQHVAGALAQRWDVDREDGDRK
jgi:hypothetical protein